MKVVVRRDRALAELNDRLIEPRARTSSTPSCAAMIESWPAVALEVMVMHGFGVTPPSGSGVRVASASGRDERHPVNDENAETASENGPVSTELRFLASVPLGDDAVASTRRSCDNSATEPAAAASVGAAHTSVHTDAQRYPRVFRNRVFMTLSYVRPTIDEPGAHTRLRV